uniref:Uncharacterized protein n=1 Tax=Vitis vinifera TaxID=29760 RepID=F6HX17_VITVI
MQRTMAKLMFWYLTQHCCNWNLHNQEYNPRLVLKEMVVCRKPWKM